MGTVVETLPKEMNKEWEWWRFSPLVKPHFIPDGHGAYELVIEVWCYSAAFGCTVDVCKPSLRRLTALVFITRK